MKILNTPESAILVKLQKAALFIILLLWILPGTVIAQNEIRSLMVDLEISHRDTTRVWILRDLAYYYQELNLDSAKLYSQKGFDLARDLGFASGQIWNLYQKALAHEFDDEFPEAIATFQEALNLATINEDSLSMAKLRNSLGVAHYYKSDYAQALAHYYKGLALSEAIGYHEGAGYALNNLGVIYRQRRDFKNALETYQKAIQVKELEQDSTGLVNSHYNLGLLYSYTQNHEASLAEFQKAFALSRNQKTERNLAELNIGLGIALYNLNDFEKAYSKLNEGIENLKADKNHEKISALTYLGILEIQKGQGNSGLAKLLQAKEMVENSDRLELKRQVSKELAQGYELLGFPEDAINSYKAYNRYNDSINSEQRLWAIEEMQARFETIEKDKQIKQQEEILASEKRKKTQAAIVLTCAFLAGIGGLYIYVKRWQKRINKPTASFAKVQHPNGINIDKINTKLLSKLTNRESEVIMLVEKGMTNHEIADRLFVSENTVKTHLKNIYSKTTAQNRTELLHKLRNY